MHRRQRNAKAGSPAKDPFPQCGDNVMRRVSSDDNEPVDVVEFLVIKELSGRHTAQDDPADPVRYARLLLCLVPLLQRHSSHDKQMQRSKQSIWTMCIWPLLPCH